MKILSDTDSERGLLAALIQGGSMSYNEIVIFDISDNTFNLDSHKVIFKCLDKIFKSHDNVTPDVPLIYSASADLGLKHHFQKDEEICYLKAIMDLQTKSENLTNYARKIKKLEIARNAVTRSESTLNELREVTGDESIGDIFGIMERNVIDCASLFSFEDMGSSAIGEGIQDYFSALENNPIDHIGVSTGFPVYDEAIGGGLRKASVNVICARAKIGKSTLCLNMGKHIASLGIPVIYLDTELIKEDSWNRLVACISEVNLEDVETGKYVKFTATKDKVRSAISEVEKLPIEYVSIAGQPLETQLAFIKRWIITKVGLNKNGTAKDCVIIYDYLKIMDQEAIKQVAEYQAIGFLMSSLINFAKKYMIPVLAMIQTNREGINKEDASVISLSDRILWFCSSMALFKRKTSEEMDQDGWEHGNRKLKILEARHGPGMHEMDYINCNFNGSIAKIKEGKTKFEIEKIKKSKDAMNSLDLGEGDVNPDDESPYLDKTIEFES